MRRRIGVLLAVAAIAGVVLIPTGGAAASSPTHATFCDGSGGTEFDIELHDVAPSPVLQFGRVEIHTDFAAGLNDIVAIGLGSGSQPSATDATAVGGNRFAAGDYAVTMTLTDTGAKNFDEQTIWDVRLQGTLPDGTTPLVADDRVYRVRWLDQTAGGFQQLLGTLVFTCGQSAPPPLNPVIEGVFCSDESDFHFDINLHDVYAPAVSQPTPDLIV